MGIVHYLVQYRLKILLVIIGLFIYVLTMSTPLYIDDYRYGLVWSTQNEIKTIFDVIQSQITHYSEQNGRLVTHFIVQMFSGVFEKSDFNIVNSFVFCLFLSLFARYVTSNKENWFKIVSLLLFLLLIGIRDCGFRECFLWLSGSCNYLWSATFVLFYLLLYRKTETFEVSSFLVKILLLITGVLIGWTHEGFMIPLAGAVLLNNIISRKRISVEQWCLSIGLFLGVLLIIVAPASLNRANRVGALENPLMQIHSYIYFILYLIKNTTFVIITFVCLCILCCFSREQAWELVKENRIIVFALVLAVAFAVFVKMHLIRVLFATEFYSLLFLLQICRTQIERLSNNIYYVLSLVSFTLLLYVTPFALNNLSSNKNIERQILNDKNGIVSIDYTEYNNYIERFILRPYIVPTRGTFLMFDQNSLHSRYMADYYHKDRVVFLSGTLIHDMKNNPESFVTFNLNKNHLVYLKRIDSTIETTLKADFIFKKEPVFLNGKLKNVIKWFFPDYFIEQMPVQSMYRVNYYGIEYWAIPLLNPVLTNRLLEIRCK